MKINYFQQGGSTPYRTASPDKAYEDPLDIIKLRLNQAGFEGTKAILPGTTKPLEQLSPVSTYKNPLFKSALNEAWWLKQANDATSGLFKTIDDIIAWQKANGLVADGKFGKNSVAKWNALNSKPVPAASAEDKSLDLMIQAGEKLAANKLLRLTSNLFSGIQSGITTENQYPAMLQTENRNNTIRLNADIINRRQNPLQFYAAFKQGGQINYFQQGGQVDPVTAVIQSLILNPQETYMKLEQLMQQGQQKQVNAILGEIKNRAVNGDPQAQAAIQALQQVIQGGQLQTQPTTQQAPVAKNGAKLNYLKQLKGKCPEGEELVYMKKGGVVCPVCQKKKGGEVKNENKKQFFGKDKKVNKALMGVRLTLFPEATDSVTVREKIDSQGNGFRQETFPNDSVSVEMFGKRFPGFAGNYGNPKINISPKGKKVITEGANLPVSLPDTLHGADSTYINNKYKEILNNKAKLDTTYKVPIVPMDKKGGRAQFFKKEPKAPLAKCGKKVMAKCGCKAKKKK